MARSYPHLTKKLVSTTALTMASFALFAAPVSAKNVGDYDVWEFQNTNPVESSQGYVKFKGDRIIDNLVQEDIGRLGHVNIDARLTVATGVEAGPMTILGKLTSTGDVYVLDSNGFLFGENAVISTNNFMAIGGTIENNILDGNGILDINVAEGAEINIQEGASISVAEAGIAAFVAPTIRNAGVINARLGKVVFAAGETVTLDLYGDRLVEIAVDDKLADAIIEHKGEINAEGGTVQMTAQAAKEAVDNIINVEGLTTVASATVKGGRIILSGGEQGAVNVAGKLDASGTQGGEIEVTGQYVVADNNAELHASGLSAGGAIRFGGDRQGGGDTPTSDYAFIDEFAIFRANALEDGQGGDITIWSDEATFMFGSAEAKGGLLGGDGGFVEVSSLGYFDFGGTVDTTAANGETGTFLLDPRDIIIIGGTGEGDDANLGPGPEDQKLKPFGIITFLDDLLNTGFEIYASEIEGQSVNNNIFIQASRSISTVAGGDNEVNLATNRSITIQTLNDQGTVFVPFVGFVPYTNSGSIDLSNLGFTTSGTGSINVNAAITNDAVGDVILGNLAAENGNINVDTLNGSITWNGDVTTQGGNVIGVATEQNRVNGSIATNSGHVTLIGGGEAFNNDKGVRIANGATVTTNGGNVSLDGTTTRAIVHGSVDAGTGNVDIAANTLQMWGNGTIIGNEVFLDTQARIIQTGATPVSKIVANRLTGGSGAGVTLTGQNEIKELGDFAASTNRANEGFALNDVNGGLDVTGTVSTTGGDIDIITSGPKFHIQHTANIASNGGDIDLTNTTGHIRSQGIVDATGSAGDVTFTSSILDLNGNSVVKAGTMIVQAGLVSQGANSTIIAARLEGEARKTALFGGVNNEITTLGDFVTGTASGSNGGFTLVNAQGLDVDGAVSTSGTGAAQHSGHINLDVDGDLNILSGGSFDAMGGNIELFQTGIFTNIDDDSVKTANSGTITLYQNDGGLIQDPIDAIHNTGIGQNTLYVGAGSFAENVLVDKDLSLIGAQAGVDARGRTAVAETVVSAVSGDVFEITGKKVSFDGFTISGGNRGIEQIHGSSIASASLLNIQNTIFESNGGDTLRTGGVETVTLNRSVINNAGSDGVDINDAATVTITDNTITNASLEGLELEDVGTATVTGNSILNSGNTGLELKGALGSIILTGNVFNGTPVYIANKIAGFVLDASNNSFNSLTSWGPGFNPSTSIADPNNLTQAERDTLFELEDKTDHILDDVNYGTVVYLAGNWFATTNTNGIQAAVDAASAGDTVHVNKGLYEETVVVDKLIDLLGYQTGIDARSRTGDETIVQADLSSDIDSRLQTSVFTFEDDSDGTLFDGFTVNGFVTRNGNLRGTVRIEEGADNLTVSNNIISSDVNPTSVQTNMPNELWVEGDGVTVTQNKIVRSSAALAQANNGSGSSNSNPAIRLEGVDGANVSYNIVDGGPIASSTSTGLIELKNNTVSNSVSEGIWASNASGTLEIDNNKIDGTNYNGIAVSNSTGNVDITNNTIGSALDGVFDGITVINTANADISGNTVWGNSNFGINIVNSFNADVFGNAVNNFLVGIRILDSDSTDVFKNTLNDNTDGIAVLSSDNVEIGNSNTANKNIIAGGSTGIRAEGSDNLRIVRNEIKDQTGSGSNGVGDGIYIIDSDENVILQNQISGQGGNGIQVRNGSDNVVIGHNGKGNILSDIAYNGITVRANSQNPFIQDNTITGVRQGIFVQGSKKTKIDGAYIDDNTITDFKKNAIWAANITNSDIFDNLIDNAGNNSKGVGVHVSLASDLDIGDDGPARRNRIKNVDTGIIVKRNSDDVRIDDNDLAGVDYGIVISESTNVVAEDNEIEGNSEVGITVEDSSFITIGGGQNRGNDIEGFKTGLKIESNDNVLASWNEFEDNSGINIHVIDSDGTNYGNGVRLEDNEINGGQTGILIESSDFTLVEDNDIENIIGNGNDGAGDGVNIAGSDDVKIHHNQFEDIGDDAIDAGQGSDNIIITLNDIENVNDSGITVRSNSQNPFIQDNTIDGAKNGIRVYGTGGQKIDSAFIDDNDVFDFEDYAVWVNHATDADIRDNLIDNQANGNGGTAILVQKSDDVTVGGDQAPNRLVVHNRIKNVDTAVIIEDSNNVIVGQNDIEGVDYGILAEDTTNLIVGDNDIQGNSEIGIGLTGVVGAVIGGSEETGNTVNNFWTGIKIINSNDVVTSWNTVTNGYNSIKLLDSSDLLVANNSLTSQSFAGIYGQGIDEVDILNNDIFENGTYGILIAESVEEEFEIPEEEQEFTGEEQLLSLQEALFETPYLLYSPYSSLPNGDITIAGNNLTDNPTGLRAEGGNIDISDLLNPNTFTNTTDELLNGIQLDGENVSLVGDTIGASIFQGFLPIGNFYVRFETGTLLDGANNPIVIDGLNASFDGFIPASQGGILSATQLANLENRIYDADDAPVNGQGNLFVGELPPVSLTLENVEDFLNNFANPLNNLSGLNVTILGLPSVLPQNLPNISPFAGDEEGGPVAPQDIEPAAGGGPLFPQDIEPGGSQEVTCWGDAVNAGGPVTFTFGGIFENGIEEISACNTGGIL